MYSEFRKQAFLLPDFIKDGRKGLGVESFIILFLLANEMPN